MTTATGWLPQSSELQLASPHAHTAGWTALANLACMLAYVILPFMGIGTKLEPSQLEV